MIHDGVGSAGEEVFAGYEEEPRHSDHFMCRRELCSLIRRSMLIRALASAYGAINSDR